LGERAVMVLLASIVTVMEFCTLTRSPLQPVKMGPGEATAVSVTTLPFTKSGKAHTVPPAIPSGSLLTALLPSPT
jgi:hypothetical protein